MEITLENPLLAGMDMPTTGKPPGAADVETKKEEALLPTGAGAKAPAKGGTEHVDAELVEPAAPSGDALREHRRRVLNEKRKDAQLSHRDSSMKMAEALRKAGEVGAANALRVLADGRLSDSIVTPKDLSDYMKAIQLVQSMADKAMDSAADEDGRSDAKRRKFTVLFGEQGASVEIGGK